MITRTTSAQKLELIAARGVEGMTSTELRDAAGLRNTAHAGAELRRLELAGCVVASGLKRGQAVVWFTTGRPAPVDARTRRLRSETEVITVRCSPELHALLIRLAEHEGQSLNALCVETLQGLIEADVVNTPEGKLYPWDADYPEECRA